MDPDLRFSMTRAEPVENLSPFKKKGVASMSRPKFSVVTPTYNQGAYIEKTIDSVLSQGYPNLEFIIIDGGSKDNTVEVIKKYERHLTYWVSEPDRGNRQATPEALLLNLAT